jgi:hypothetical protein
MLRILRRNQKPKKIRLKLKKYQRKRKLPKNYKLKLRRRNKKEKRGKSSWRIVRKDLSNSLVTMMKMDLMMGLITKWMIPTLMLWNGIKRKMLNLNQNNLQENHKKTKKSQKSLKRELQSLLIKHKMREIKKLMLQSLIKRRNKSKTQIRLEKP